MYYRKREDTRRLKKLINKTRGYPPAAYFDDRKNHLIRYWKSTGKNSMYAYNKKEAHKKMRRYDKKEEYYTKKSYDLWWKTW